MQGEDNQPKKFASKLSVFQQKKREIQCAVHLARKLQMYVDGDVEGFKNLAREEATELSQSPFGATLLAVIGNCYTEFTQSEIGGVSGLSASVASTSRGVSTRFNIAKAGLRAAASAKDAQAAHTALSEKEKARLEKESKIAAPTGENSAPVSQTEEEKANADSKQSTEDAEDILLKAKLERTTSHM